MARQISEGFEAGDTLPFTGFLGGGTVTANVAGRTTGLAVRFNNTFAGSLLLTSAQAEVYLKVAILPDNAGTLNVIRWYSGANELGSFRRNTSTQFAEIYTGTATLQTTGNSQITVNNWKVVEIHIKIADSGGIIEYKLDGILQSAYTFSGDTKPGTDTTIDRIYVGNAGTFNAYFDDFCLNDITGGADNSWVGDSHFYGLVPNADGDSSQFVGSDGNSTNNYLLVDEIPSNGDTDYVESPTSGNKDFYNLANLPTLAAGSQIYRVIVETRARETTADGQSIQLGIKSGGVESFAASVTVGTSFARQTAVFTLDPNGSVAWTETAINALQAGVKIP